MLPGTLFKSCLLAGHANRLAGKIAVAQKFYQRAKVLATDTGANNDITVAIVYEQLCVYSTGKNKEPIESLIPLLSQPLNAEALIVLNQALANIFRSAADYHNSKKHFKEAIRLAKSIGCTWRVMECKGELGRAYRSSGCYSKALKRQEKFLNFATGRGDVLGTASACGYVGFTNFSMGLKYYTEAVKYLYSRLMLCKDELDDISGYRWCLNNLGKVYLDLKEYNVCIELFLESARIAKDLGNTLGLGTAYGNLGSAYRAVGRHEDAITYHKLYQDIAERNSDIGGVAIMQRELILDHLHLSKCTVIESEKAVFLDKARQYGIEALKTSLEVRSRIGRSEDMLKIGNFEHNQARIFSLLLFVLVQRNLHDVSLIISELGRASALADRIGERFKLESVFTSEALSILGEGNEINDTAVARLSNKIGELAKESKSDLMVYSMLEDPLTKESLLYNWHVGHSDVNVQVHFNQQIIGSSKCLPNCNMFSDHYLMLLLREIGIVDDDDIPTDETEALSLESSDQVALSGKPRDIIRRRVPKSDCIKDCGQTKRALLEEVYEVLIGPMIQNLNVCPSGNASRLVIIPHGALFRVPFCALRRGSRHLVEDFIISTCPSLRILLDINLQREKVWPQQDSSGKPVHLLAVGNPTMPTNDLQLPGAEEEVQSIASIVGKATVLCGPDATKRDVLAGFTKYPVVHLATHAILESSLDSIEEPTPKQYEVGNYEVKGAIILAKSDDSCNGILTSSEIEGLKLDSGSELVVLNCCNTGKGTITGDGVLGLSRSLMCAGVMTMIVTLWRIEDKSAALLMKKFYGLYKESRDAPSALHFSMLHMIQLGYGCKKWAAFCCIGVKTITL